MREGKGKERQPRSEGEREGEEEGTEGKIEEEGKRRVMRKWVECEARQRGRKEKPWGRKEVR